MSKKLAIPPPAHPHKRREPLPWQAPKPAEEDCEALLRVKAILDSPSYRRADTDIDFLSKDGVRGVRLQIDYLKAELLLEEHQIHQTVVVFGGTRISEPKAASRNVDALRVSLAADPTNPIKLTNLIFPPNFRHMQTYDHRHTAAISICPH